MLILAQICSNESKLDALPSILLNTTDNISFELFKVFILLLNEVWSYVSHDFKICDILFISSQSLKLNGSYLSPFRNSNGLYIGLLLAIHLKHVHFPEEWTNFNDLSKQLA